MNPWRCLLLPALCVSSFLTTGTVLAHKPSDAYLTLTLDGAQVTGEWHLALRDLDYAIGLDADDDGCITWKELRSQAAAVQAYALSRLRISAGTTDGRLQMRDLLVDHHSDGAYAVLRFYVKGLPGPAVLKVQYQAFFDVDPLHRGLLRLESSSATRLAVFSPESSRQEFDVRSSGSHTWTTFVQEGIGHIWTGYDHVLFLIALLLPAALQRRSAGWEARADAGLVLVDILKTVSAFTLAHSITLSLAALDLMRLPPRFVESAIAASVVVAGTNNLFRLFPDRGWVMAFLFGLVHGFGFANALADLGLRRAGLVPALFGFNLGVEVGQLVIVGVFLPLAIPFRHRAFYRRCLLPVGSGAIALMALVWLAERMLDVGWFRL